MDENQFKEIISRLDLITRLLALDMVKDLKTQKDKILALNSFGFKPKEIADYLSTKGNTVSVALSKARKLRRVESDDKQRNKETST
jgi:DNA-directed RNA polymerase specialized sigma24 family protein